MIHRWHPLSCLKVVLLALWLTPTARAKYTPFLPQSFFFSYDPSSETVPIPVTEQCQQINITWGRLSATGPNPVAPYFLQVYTSAFIVPFIIPAGNGLSFQWTVPFAPGTLYQICMFDINGNTGGCQASYTVIQGATTSCPNVTFPAGAMDVEGRVWNGPLSQYGWIEQCTDLAVTPKNGTPPYTFTIAPTLHPPFNITSNVAATMNWTVSLSWASQFYISVIDSVGNSWSNGPLHSGEGTTSDCLAISSMNPPTQKRFPLALTASIASGVGGLIIGTITAYIFLCRRAKREHTEDFIAMGKSASPEFGRTLSVGPRYRRVPTSPVQYHDGADGNTIIGQESQYHIEPFVLPSEEGRLTNAPQGSLSNDPSSPTGPRSEPDSQTGSHGLPSTSHHQQVYVVHHDAGRAPVTVYTAAGTEVVELPPTYVEGSSQGDTSPRRRTAGSSQKGDSRSVGSPG